MVEVRVPTDDGAALRVVTAGDTRAPTLLLLNSLGTDLTMWDPQVAGWSEHRHVVRFDQRGHGSSEAPAAAFDLSRLARDATTVLDHLGIERAEICGISLGGLVALRTALDAADRVSRLVLADTAARIGTEQGWSERAQLARTAGMDAVADVAIAKFFSPDFLATGQPVIEETRTILRRSSVEGYARSCEVLASADLRDEVAGIEHATLVIVGDEDQATPLADAQQVADTIPAAELVVLERAGHLSNLERPVEFADVVTEFLGHVGSPSDA